MSDSPSLLRRLDNTHVPMLIARAVLGGAFIYYALHKIGAPMEFLKQIKQYELLPLSPPQYINMTAVALPWIELVCGAMLLAGFWLRGSAATVGAMLAAFTAAIFIRSLRVYAQGGQSYCEIAFNCGCGGGDIIICTKLAINLSMIALAGVALWSRSRFFTMEAAALRAKLEDVPPSVEPLPVEVASK